MPIYINKDQINNGINNEINGNYILYILLSFIIITFIVEYFRINNLILIFLVSIVFILLVINIFNSNDYDKNKITRLIENINDSNYDVIIIDDFLSANECDKLVNYSKTQDLIISETLGEYGNVTSDYRKSEQMWITDEQNIIAKKISDFCESILNLPKENMESAQLVKYDVSGYFKEHYDSEPDKTKNNNIKDRAHTFIVYLNDVEEGGETRFPKINLNIKPKKGTAMYFKTLMPNGVLLEKSLHQGMPIICGEKYIVNKWIHLNKFNS